MDELEKNNSFVRFTVVRAQFEDFMIANKELLHQISRENRGQLKAVHAIKQFLSTLFKVLYANRNADDGTIFAHMFTKFPYLKRVVQEPNTAKTSTEFTPAVTNRVFIPEKLEKATRCWICNARIPDYGISFDHIQDRKHAGSGDVSDAGFSHHFCNSAKDAIIPAKAKYACPGQ